MATQKTWRCAIVGVGMAGESHVRALKKVPNATLVAVCDSDNAKAVAALAKHGVSLPIHPDLEDPVRQGKDRRSAHRAPQQLPSRRGDRSNGTRRQCHHRKATRYHPRAMRRDYRRRGSSQGEACRDLSEPVQPFEPNGEVGHRRRAIRAAHLGGGVCPLGARAEVLPELRGTKEIDGGGAIMNNSIHSIDLLQWMVGPIASVSAYADARVHKQLEVEDTLTCALRFADGALGTIVGTTGMFPGRPAHRNRRIQRDRGDRRKHEGVQVPRSAPRR